MLCYPAVAMQVRSLRVVLILVLLSVFAVATFAQPAGAPRANKVEPPNWWIGLPRDPMLLVYGEGLAGARVTTSYAGVTITKVEPQPNGRHAFVWVKVASTAKSGDVEFRVQGAGGTSSFTWHLDRRESTAGKFQGISQDDVLYLIMPDRFADGNIANDNPPESPGQTDRSQSRKWHGGD